MEIALTPVLDDGEEGPPAVSLNMPQAFVPEVGDTMLIVGTAWTCVHRAWHFDVSGGKLELYIERNPNYTAVMRRKQIHAVPSGSEPPALPG